MNKTPAQIFALVFGVVYLVMGLLGFAVTGFDEFAGKGVGEELIIFPVNPLHNIVHLGLGAVWLGAAGKHASAKSVNLAFGVVLGLFFVLGMVGALEFLAIKDAGSTDNYLHVATAALALYFGSVGAEGPARAT
ncbi:MAG: DUF4383 domain-containing protein [Actinobacteria bacterium]|nr:DUF4383 domain-containing protein [Actinomycetota bacterium]